MAAPRTARQLARAELTDQIKAAARDQVAETGAADLSLRAVARELGMASSAVYRYFRSRDELLTALIVDSYLALAATLSAADRGRTPRARWLAVCHALRGWAIDHPYEYALLYGTPVPGYRAPQDTVEPAARVLLLPLGILIDAAETGTLDAEGAGPHLGVELSGQLERLRSAYAEIVPTAVLARYFQALAQLFGVLSLELFGHFVGSLDPAGPFFDHTAEELADRLGLAP